MSHLFKRTRPGLALALLAGLAVATGAPAQPTGNPKGTAAPPESSTQRSGIAPRPKQPDISGADGGKLVGNEAQTRARMQTGKPANTGTAGGLGTGGAGAAQGTKAQAGAIGDTGARSDRGSAQDRPVPPSR